MVSLLVHITLMLYLSSLYRGGGSPPAQHPVTYEFAIVQDEQLTEIESVELDDLVSDAISEIEDLPEESSTAELEADVAAAELEVTSAGALPTLGGAGDGTGGDGTLSGGGAGTSFFGVSCELVARALVSAVTFCCTSSGLLRNTSSMASISCRNASLGK